MSLPQLEQNGVFTHVYPVEDLGLPETIAITGTEDAEVFSTGVPATVVILSKLSAGSATLKVKLVGDGEAVSFGSPDYTLAQSGTSMQCLVFDTAFTYDDSNGSSTTISVDDRFVAIREEAGGSGCTFEKLAVLVLYELTPGEEWFLGVRSAAGAVMSKDAVGDGHGKLSLAPSLEDNAYIDADVVQ